MASWNSCVPAALSLSRRSWRPANRLKSPPRRKGRSFRMRDSGIDDRTRARIAALPPFADQAPESWRLEPLGGLTNRNVKLSRDGESYVVRLAGRGTDRYINRAREAHNAGVAASLGLCPEV